MRYVIITALVFVGGFFYLRHEGYIGANVTDAGRTAANSVLDKAKNGTNAALKKGTEVLNDGLEAAKVDNPPQMERSTPPSK